ncbi:MAG: OmpA family protein [Deltaproteobacteria bacterium]|nr:OmpA family protein [Deltaproteobacteria bacterium]MBI3391371.1 OmpA family protein [Deltaproteobacteria bacterium]
MKNSFSRLSMAALVLAAASNWAVAGDGVVAGVDLGFAAPVSSFNNKASVGGMLSPFAGYMVNDYAGMMAQVQVAGMPNDSRPAGVPSSDQTWALGAHAGPRLALPLKDVELYGTWQGGVFTGLTAHTPISRTSWGYSTGGGVNFRMTDQILLGLVGRYNWLDQHVGSHNVKYVTGGVSVTYNVEAPSAPPPAPRVVAQAPPPRPAPAKKKIVLRGVNFDFDKSVIRADGKPVLDEAIATLKKEGGVAVISEGYTDSKGTDEYNQKLSERRAQAVRDYLVKGGIAADRIRVEGFGETHPVASNDTDDGRAQNRRVELRIRGE